MKVKTFTCPCGNTNPERTAFYDGGLGYEAVICTDCGNYSDFNGENKADEWSLAFVRPQNPIKQL